MGLIIAAIAIALVSGVAGTPVMDAASSSELIASVATPASSAADADVIPTEGSRTVAGAAGPSAGRRGSDRPGDGPAAPTAAHSANLSWRLRSFFDHQNIGGTWIRHAADQGVMATYRSDLTPGAVGFGVDFSAFAAYRWAATSNAANMGHLNGDGSVGSPVWIYPGLYDLRAQWNDLSVKLGSQMISNPFLEPSFNRVLPPTFLGTAVDFKATSTATLHADYVTKGVYRGRTELQPLTTSYGGVAVDRYYCMGVTDEEPGDRTLSMFVGRAENVWKQLNVEGAAPVRKFGSVALRADADAYATVADGARREGPIANVAYSLALVALRGTGRVVVSYQHVVGDQFFDYLSETWGESLENASVVDFNAPHEQSLKLRIVFGQDELTVRGLKVSAWATLGWASDGRVSAGLHADASDPLHSLYWRNGQPIGGRHNEVGVNPSYTIPDGRMRGGKLAVIGAVHRSGRTASDPSVHEYRVTFDLPLR